MGVRPEVETAQGRVAGTEVRGIRIFRGIPFASPPLGSRRFHAPEAPEPWTGTLEATKPGAVAHQASLPLMSFMNAGGARQSEDCLHLNVWSPGLDGAKRPVLVWIHGGGFLIGAGSTRVYDGHSLAQRGDLVVVTFNYRLGAFGFMHLNGIGGDEFAGASNAGIRDQIAALEWVHENIERFGGNPDNVTVCGQSAGAMSIGALLGAPRARKLFHRGICQSGAAHNVIEPERANEVAEIYLGELGGPPRTIDALARIPAARLLKAQGAANRKLANLKDMMSFLPVVDGDVIPEQPIEAIRRGAARDIPLLIGTTLDEWKLFTAIDSGVPVVGDVPLAERFRDLLPEVAEFAPEHEAAAWQYREAVRQRGGKTSAFEVWSAFQSSRVFHYPASVLAESQSSAGGTSFAYLFTWRPPALRRALGAFHGIDIPFVFGITSHPIVAPLTGLAPSATRLARRMQNAWSAFARFGRPANPTLPDWEPYDASTRATMVFGRDCYLANAPLEAERNLWSQWSDSANNDDRQPQRA
jgi:para-nitrobenzyl esterase